MNPRRFLRTLAGLLLWGAAAIAVGRLLGEERRGGSSTLKALGAYLGQREARVEVRFPRPVLIDVGAAVYVADRGVSNRGEGAVREEVAGQVEALLDDQGRPQPLLYGEARAAVIRLYDRRRPLLRANARAVLVEVPQTFDWVARTLFTKETVVKIAEEWNRTMLEHRDEFFVILTPVARDLVFDVEQLMESELPAFLERHREEALELGKAVEQDLGGDNLVDLFHREILPLAEKKLRPVMEEVGGEVWKQFPIWSLSWRLAYQSLPLTENDHFQRAWNQFVASQVLPIIKAHSADIAGSIREIGREALAKEEVAAHFRKAFSNLASNPQFLRLAQEFIKEAILDNDRFHALMREHWESPAVEAAVKRASLHLEPMVRRMSDFVVGTREEGITKEFARVLRSQIFLKDQQRIVLYPGVDGPLLAPGQALAATMEVEGEN